MSDGIPQELRDALTRAENTHGPVVKDEIDVLYEQALEELMLDQERRGLE